MITITFSLEDIKDRKFVKDSILEYEIKKKFDEAQLSIDLDGETPIEDLWLTTRSEKGLIGSGIRTVEQLLPLTEVEIKRMINIGRKSTREIMNARKAFEVTGMTESQHYDKRIS